MSQILTNFRLILVSPQTSGNVGSCARAAANFGITDIHVTDPRCDIWDEQAKMFGKGPARDTLLAMKKTASLAESLADCTHALAFTRRIGDKSPAEVQFSELANWIAGVLSQGIVDELTNTRAHEHTTTDAKDFHKQRNTDDERRNQRIALIFGREDRCLFADEMELCTHFCLIPVDPKMPTLNLSHAVAVVLSRLYTDWLEQGLIDTKETYKPVGTKNILSSVGAQHAAPAIDGHGTPCPYIQDPHLTPCSISEFEGLVGHLREIMVQVGLTQAGNPDRMLLRLRRSLQRATLTQQDVSVWRGLLARIVQKVPGNS